MKGYKVIELGEAIELQRGYDLTSAQMEPGTIPVAGSNGVIGHHNVSKTSAPAITIGRSGTIGKVHFYNEPIWPHNTSLFITNYKGNNSRYIYYLLQQVDFKKVCDSSVIPSLNRNFVYPIKVKFVSDLDEQRKIAAVLTALDDKIALNRRINDKLEAMAKRLYDYWFVQFDFPDENGRPYKSSGGKMVWNETLKREIPEGWEVVTFDNFLEIGNGKDHSHLAEGPIPVYGSGGFMRGVTEYLYDGESVLFPRKGTLNNIMYRNEKFWTVDTMFYSKMKLPNSAIYMFYTAKQFDYEKLNTGTGVPSMTSVIIKRLPVINPTCKLLTDFDSCVQSMYTKIIANRKQSSYLTALRDHLLPLLMNAQVDVGG